MFRLGLEREMVEQGKDLLEEQERIKGELENRIQNEEQERKKEKEEIYKDFEQVYRSICIPSFSSQSDDNCIILLHKHLENC